MDKVVAACESAKENPGEENSFRQLRLDQWVKQSIRWMPMTKWDACAFPVNEKDLEGRICFGGLGLIFYYRYNGICSCVSTGRRK
jgi:hypothetical protein